MSVKIRLARVGKNKRAIWHIVVSDTRSARDKRIIERIGFYDPKPNPSIIEVKGDRALYWISKGGKPSRTVYVLLKKKGIIQPANKKAAPQAAPAPETAPAPEAAPESPKA